MRLKCTLMYDGTNFNGWQIQPNVRTVQEEIESVLSYIHKYDVSIHASGRTDTSVHAFAQVFHFDTSLDIDMKSWVKAINSRLPDDIRILEVMEVSDTFHARYDAKSKSYVYKINTGSYDLFNRNYMYQYNKALDTDAMQEIAELFLGVHDFTSFNATPLDVIENQTREITQFDISKSNDIITLTITGTGFLKHMVRMLVATCIAYSNKKLTKEIIIDALNNPDKRMIPVNVPGCGLCLFGVKY